MRKEAYTLANEIGAKWKFDTSYQKERLEIEEIEKYKKAVMNKIRMENKKGSGKGSHRMVAAAACMAALIFSTAVFGEKVYAAIEQISWNIGSALGLSGDLAAYSSVVHTSVTDSGYVITLQEVVVAEKKLVANYTLQREDGEPMEKIYVPVGNLSINGKTSLGGSSGGGQFLNEEHTITGIEMSYDIIDYVDLAQENSYQLKFEEIDIDSVKGKWNFQFTADGTDLIADTLRVSLQKEFFIEDGVSIVLEELTLNELEQRISYHIEGSSDYIAMVQVEDGAGHLIKFNTSRFDGRSGNGYMLNEEIIEDGRIAEDAESVTFTLYVVPIPRESGQMSNDYVQVGEAFTVDIH
ncbi:MAG: DUF4179 domain-containing protein [Lachnospiraceae bacterium]|nr:DUF4179 domain-containing protein [Lachnospiraceae bacterium]